MTEGQISTYRRLLLEKRTQLRNALSVSDIGCSGDHRFPDCIEQSAHALETTLQVRLRRNNSRLLTAVEAAMGRIDRRTFGVAPQACGPELERSERSARDRTDRRAIEVDADAHGSRAARP